MTGLMEKLARGAALVSVLGLAACGGATTSTGGGTAGAASAPTAAEAVQWSALIDADVARIQGIAGTVFNQVPTTGSATFTGPGSVRIFDRVTTGTTNTETTVVDMAGTARVSVYFGSSTMSGSITDLYAVDTAGQTGGVTGSVDVRGTLPRAVGQPNALDAKAAGTLQAFGTDYTIETDVDGLLRGTNPGSSTIVRAIDLTGEGTVTGSTSLSGVTIVGDKFVGGGTGAFVNR